LFYFVSDRWTSQERLYKAAVLNNYMLFDVSCSVQSIKCFYYKSIMKFITNFFFISETHRVIHSWNQQTEQSIVFKRIIPEYSMSISIHSICQKHFPTLLFHLFENVRNKHEKLSARYINNKKRDHAKNQLNFLNSSKCLKTKHTCRLVLSCLTNNYRLY